MLTIGENMLKIQKVSKSFGDQVLLDNVDMIVEKNQVTVLVGKSGEGKTTLFRMIMGLDTDYKGQIILSEESYVGMVFQKFELYPHLTVLSNLVLPQRVIKKISKRQAYNKSLKILEELDIKYLINKTISSLSGGEAQRLAIARTLVMDNNIILFDEPTSSLDQENTRNFIELLRGLVKTKTLLIITHDIEFAKEVADIIYAIKGKEIIKYSFS